MLRVLSSFEACSIGFFWERLGDILREVMIFSLCVVFDQTLSCHIGESDKFIVHMYN